MGFSGKEMVTIYISWVSFPNVCLEIKPFILIISQSRERLSTQKELEKRLPVLKSQ